MVWISLHLGGERFTSSVTVDRTSYQIVYDLLRNAPPAQLQDASPEYFQVR